MTTRAIRMPISQVRQFDWLSSLFIGPGEDTAGPAGG